MCLFYNNILGLLVNACFCCVIGLVSLVSKSSELDHSSSFTFCCSLQLLKCVVTFVFHTTHPVHTLQENAILIQYVDTTKRLYRASSVISSKFDNI